MVTAATTGPGQSGYVHYFVIEPAGGEPETQVGIELPDDRIAWSFPDLGVVVSPFIESGEILAGGKAYAVRHLYGVRPFPDEESMRVLQRDLWSRVIPWVEDETPYCSLGTQSGSCLSCLGFVLRVLYPPVSGGMPALPPDFESAGPAMYFSTEDLLLYQTGLHGNRSREERLRLIDALNLPSRLRDDLVQLADALDPGDIAAPVPPAASKKTAASKRPAGRSYTRTGQQRPLPRKKL